MCVAAARAEFSGTTVYAGEVEQAGRVVHVLGYENTARNLAGATAAFGAKWLGSRPAPTGNAMLLHFPAAVGSMSRRPGPGACGQAPALE